MGIYQAEGGPSGRPDPSAVERLKKLVKSITCQDCGKRPSSFVANSYSGGQARRRCLCKPCHDRAEARGVRAAIDSARASGDYRRALRLMRASVGPN